MKDKDAKISAMEKRGEELKDMIKRALSARMEMDQQDVVRS